MNRDQKRSPPNSGPIGGTPSAQGSSGKLTVIVPTYWGPVREYEFGLPSPAYDHPTPPTEAGTLPRLLDSLTHALGPGFEVILVVGATQEGVALAAEQKVKEIAALYKDQLVISVVGESVLRRWGRRWQEFASDQIPFSLCGYGNIRNVGLAAGLLSGAEILVLLDDDEAVEPGYLARAVESLRQAEAVAGKAVGVGGPYLDAAGVPFLPQKPPQGNPFLDKARHMNAALEWLLFGEGLKPTPLAFGGNMVLGRTLAQAVPFDPWIPRGEDIDYVLSSWLLGYGFYFDPRLTVTHLPPSQSRPGPCEALRRDLVRFFYQREKLSAARALGLELPIDLGPYPGRLLGDDLELQAERALRTVCGAPRAKSFVQAARECAERYCQSYFAFQQCWPGLLADLARQRTVWTSLGRLFQG